MSAAALSTVTRIMLTTPADMCLNLPLCRLGSRSSVGQTTANGVRQRRLLMVDRMVGTEGNECVELSVDVSDTHVRDTKSRDTATLRFGRDAFTAFLKKIG